MTTTRRPVRLSLATKLAREAKAAAKARAVKAKTALAIRQGKPICGRTPTPRTTSKPAGKPGSGHHPGRGCGPGKASPRRIVAFERMGRALELRKQGLTFQAIADALGITVGAAHKLVQKALATPIEDVDAVRQLENQRLDYMLSRISKKIAKGDLAAITVALKISQRRAALLGLDAPVRLESPDGAPIHFVVQVPVQAASVAEWAAQAAGTLLDAEPVRLELGDATVTAPGEEEGGQE